MDLLFRQPHRIIIGAMRRPLRPFGDVAGRKLGFVELRHVSRLSVEFLPPLRGKVAPRVRPEAGPKTSSGPEGGCIRASRMVSTWGFESTPPSVASRHLPPPGGKRELGARLPTSRITFWQVLPPQKP